MRFRWMMVFGLAALGAVGACSDATPPEPNPVVTDESTSCSDAVGMTTETNGLGGPLYVGTGTIDGAGDVDFFSFPIDAGEWIQLVGRADPTGNGLDAEVTLFDASGSTQLAYNDDSVTDGGLDSTLPYLPTTTGTACVSIADFEDTDGPFAYRVLALPIDFDLYDEFNLDTEPNNSTTEPQVGLSAFGTGAALYTKVMGTLDPATDVDVYQWDIPDGAASAVVTFPPSFGSDAYGSTTELGMVEVYEPDGTQVYARLDPRLGASSLIVPVTPLGTYFVSVHPPASGASGANPFYVLPLSTTGTQNDQETDDVANNSSDAAEAPLAYSSGSTQTSYFIGGVLPSPGDTDWWQVNAGAGNDIALFCSSWRIGSGVRDATFSIYDDPTAAPLQSEQEVEDQDVAWSNTATGASMPAVTTTVIGPHYLRVDGSAYDPEVSGAFYICGLHVLE